MVTMSYAPYARRKKKPPELEPVPIIAIPEAQVEAVDPVEQPEPESFALITEEAQKPTQVIDPQAPSDAELLDIVRPTAERYKPAPVIELPTYPGPEAPESPVAAVSDFKVVDEKPMPTEPIEETIPLWKPVFGDKKKKPIILG